MEDIKGKLGDNDHSCSTVEVLQSTDRIVPLRVKMKVVVSKLASVCRLTEIDTRGMGLIPPDSMKIVRSTFPAIATGRKKTFLSPLPDALYFWTSSSVRETLAGLVLVHRSMMKE